MDNEAAPDTLVNEGSSEGRPIGQDETTLTGNRIDSVRTSDEDARADEEVQMMLDPNNKLNEPVQLHHKVGIRVLQRRERNGHVWTQVNGWKRCCLWE